MSLLLDALNKKSGDKAQGTGLSNLTLEDAPQPRAAAASSPASASNRSAGETMFAAKKKKPAGRSWKLGLVPTTLLIALVFGSGYGYYVWLQISPASQPKLAQRVAPPPAPPVAAAAPAPVKVATPALVPFIPPQEKTMPAEPDQPMVAARNEEFDAPRNKPKAGKSYSRPAANDIVVKRKVETDTITPALLDAYQAYQRSDYVTATQGYREVLNKDAHNRDALLGLAAIAQQQGQNETAQRYYRELLVLDPRDPTAQAALMTYSPDAGNTESHLKLLLSEQPRSAALHFALGNYYAEQSGWGDAQQSYFNAHTLEPANAEFTFNLAVSLDHLGQRKLAAQYYQQALQLDVSGRSGFDHAQAQQRLSELTAAK
ncbi:cellulose synthase subunit BcsC [mine drainage metagenome]|uniref:Cellulose synthase subunit BcsC n=1 Tax=mine drainage metagenome TaxID=410659 RepID=A0A1J5TH68_9ZZZZ